MRTSNYLLRGFRYNTAIRLSAIAMPDHSSAGLLNQLTRTSSIVVEKLQLPLAEPLPMLACFLLDEIQLLNEVTPTEDIFLDLLSVLCPPPIESINLTIGRPELEGKNYSAKTGQIPLAIFDKTTGGEARASIPSTPKANRPQPKDGRAIPFNVFDLIFPLLQPKFLGGPQKNPFLPHELKPWQYNGIEFLVKNGAALLADDMGLGKTVQTIVALKILFQQGSANTTLILCPKSLIATWDDHLQKWAPELRTIVIRSTGSGRQAFWETRAHVYLTNFESFSRDAETYPWLTTKFDVTILDEIQRIKNANAEVSKACRQITSKFRWGLSGTPVENHLGDIVSIYGFIKPGLLSRKDAESEKGLMSKIEPYFLRRKAEGLPGLPAIQYDETFLDLLPKQQEAYERAEKEGIIRLKDFEDEVSLVHVLQLITSLKKICNFDDLSGESSKLDYLETALKEVTDQEHKALVFSQYPNATLRKIEPRLNSFKPQVFDGRLSSNERDRIIADFQANEKNKILLMSLRAGGVGLTLTRANYVFHFDHWWNPAVTNQATGRVARVGQAEPTVFVRSLIIRNTIEEKIQDILQKKQALFDRVIGDLSDEGLEARLTEDEMLGLFGLKRPAKKTNKVNSGQAQNIDALDPKEFEDLIEGLYERMGYRVRATPRSHDHGIDILASRQTSTGATEIIVIQCKHYPQRVVGEDKVRELWGVITNDHSVTRGVLVTSGRFSPPSQAYAMNKRIELIDRPKLERLLSDWPLKL